MALSEILSLVLSVLTVALSVIAIVISLRQGKKQNQLALMERRLNLQQAARSLIEPIEFSKNVFKNDSKNKDNTPLYAADYSFLCLTNSVLLESLQDVPEHAMESDYQNKYLKKLEELRMISDMFASCFPEEIGKPYSELAQLYVITLTGLYKYIVCLKSLKKENVNINLHSNDLELRTREAYKSALGSLLMKFEEIKKLDLYNKMLKLNKVC